MKPNRINENDARKMKEEYMTDLLQEAGMNGPQLFEINAEDPTEKNHDGTFLEVILLDDAEAVVRDRWANVDNDRTIVPINEVYAIYHALVDQVESLMVEE
jgi:hypothetical protein